jgi:thiopeptide-type bacteriocin biosynthesis protein
MMTADHRTYRRTFRSVNALTLRSCLLSSTSTPPWPCLTGSPKQDAGVWRDWMISVLRCPATSAALSHASPDLSGRIAEISAGAVTEPAKIASAGLSLVRYIARLHGRATPFGLAAGVSPATIGTGTAVRLGNRHRAIARAGAGWLSAVIEQLEQASELRSHLLVVANSTVTVRGDRLVVPFQPLRPAGSTSRTVEMSLRHIPAVRLALAIAAEPVRWDVLVAKLLAEFGTANLEHVDALLTQLLQTKALLSNLHAPSTTPDALQHLVDALAAAGAARIHAISPIFRTLQGIQHDLLTHHELDPAGGPPARQDLVDRMAFLSPAPRPLAIDTRSDADVTLPAALLSEASAAAGLLTLLSPSPFGPPAWSRYSQAFFERYGIGTLVPVLDLVDPDAGLGFPDGYVTANPEPARAITDRDLQLLALAQSAAIDQLTEIELTPELIAQLTAPGAERPRAPRHLELTFQLYAPSPAAVNTGHFDLAVTSVSRGIGTITGRFLPLLGSNHRDQIRSALAQPSSGVRRVQLSAPPLDAADAHVTRAPNVLPHLISLAEHQPERPGTIPVDDLAVATDGYQLWLASISRGRWIEPIQFNAIDLREHTPPLARFLNEINRAHTAVVTQFDWGAAARLPYLPRLRCGRVILSPASWRITATDLPTDDDLQAWAQRLAELRAQRRIPAKVLATRGDQRLPLDLEQISHAAVLRADLGRGLTVTLTEQAPQDAFGWIDGHAHELVAPLIATTPPPGTTLPAPDRQQVLPVGQGCLPGLSPWMTFKLYGHRERQDEILTEYLPKLLEDLPRGTQWWFIRYQDPQPHLRLRLCLDAADDFGPAVAAVSEWVDDLRRRRLLRDMVIAPYYPERGRWGRGDAQIAVEEVFAADSTSLLVQLTVRAGVPNRQAVTAANFVAIATAFTGTVAAAMQWFIDHANADLDKAPPREILSAAVQIADPTGDWAALRGVATGAAIVESWGERDQAIRAYRVAAGGKGLSREELLRSLLHVHHIRAVGIDRADEAICLRLARAAALTWKARRKDQA